MKLNERYYIGLDVHKKIIAYCIQKKDGTGVSEGTILATRSSLEAWMNLIDAPWSATLEATMFSPWIYDTLILQAEKVVLADPMRLKAISTAKKKNDKVDALMLCNLLRVDFIPEAHMPPIKQRILRSHLRYRNFLKIILNMIKNRTSSFLMEYGEEYSKKKLHQKNYFYQLMEELEFTPPSIIELLRDNRFLIEEIQKVQNYIIKALVNHPELKERVRLLMTIEGVGKYSALTWCLEIGDVHRFSSIRKAISYCGLCSAQKESAGKSKRGPISKQRNKHLQWVLIEIAKLSPRHSLSMAHLYDKEIKKGNKNRATLSLARKYVAYMMAVDKSGKTFINKCI